MELYQLRCFVAVIEEGGFNRATTRLHRTQPAISYQIKQLEDELGVPLIHRRSRGISATDAGRVLLQHAQEILELERRARDSLAQLGDGVSGEVRIGTVNSVGIYLLPDVLRAMRIKYPAARPTVLYRNSAEVMESLLADKIDLALVANPRPHRRLRQETILIEPVSLVCGRSHPLHGRTSVRPADLKGLQFISLTPDSPTGELVRDYLHRMGVTVEPVVSTDNVETVKKMVEVGLGVALLPDMVTSAEIPCDRETPAMFTRIEIGPPPMRLIVLATWKQRDLSPAVTAFIEELRDLGARWRGCTEGAE